MSRPAADAETGVVGAVRCPVPKGLAGPAPPCCTPGIAEVRGPAACMRRDALFRRMLLVADVLAIVGAFVLTVALSRRSLQLTWAALAGVPILLVVREAHRPLRPRRDAAAQDDARRGAEAASSSRRSARWSPGWPAACSSHGAARPPRGAVPVAGAGRAADPAAARVARALALRDRARRALPVHRRRDVRRDDPLEARPATAASRPRSSRTSTSTRSRRGRPTPSPSRASPRSATSRRRSTCTARSSRRAAPTPARCSTWCAR